MKGKVSNNTLEQFYFLSKMKMKIWYGALIGAIVGVCLIGASVYPEIFVPLLLLLSPLAVLFFFSIFYYYFLSKLKIKIWQGALIGAMVGVCLIGVFMGLSMVTPSLYGGLFDFLEIPFWLLIFLTPLVFVLFFFSCTPSPYLFFVSFAINWAAYGAIAVIIAKYLRRGKN